MTDASAGERRAHARRKVSAVATLQPSGGEENQAQLVDLSLSGALLVTQTRPDGTVDYTLRFSTGLATLDTRLRVIRSVERDGEYLLGCSFRESSEEFRRVIGELLDALTAADVPIDTSDILRDLVRTTRYELRTPLNHIVGCAEFLQEQAAEQGRDALLPDLEYIRTAARVLLGWVTATLELSRVAAGELETSLLAARMDEPIEAISQHCQRLIDVAERDWPPALPDLNAIWLAARRFTAALSQVVELTRFRISEAGAELPADRALALQAMARLRSAAQRAHVRGEPHLLVVDASEAERALLVRRLTHLGYRVSVARDGFEALELPHSGPVDLALIDVMLPEMTGADVLEAIKGDPQLAEVPAIMLSALDQIEWVAHCIELGAEDYLPKPFEPMVLQARVEASLEKRRLRAMEIEYLREVARVTDAALAVENATFDPVTLDGVAAREDGLGRLASMFQRMAREVRAREEALKQQVQQLRIEIDSVKRNQAVDEIVDSDYFRDLQQQASRLRRRQG